MTVQRRTFLSASAVGATGVGLFLLGVGQALATPLGSRATTPTTPFAVGVRRYHWTRGSRPCTTYVYYPSTGTAGGNPVTGAPVADGVFPVYNMTFGYGSSPQDSTPRPRTWAPVAARATAHPRTKSRAPSSQ
ncbi:hypothetical protein ACFFSW_17425 [Saccharothrix longispora]|uniref:Secreted protein n=1 Tax=Saccharothrix longispora TaxID=33920 RepID=A0ABU1PQ39_9PSEU|nr:hypothetical protein [Saccharothrix longispora]MDR6592581.1 hypothetical protein [Saccharothrix longispora]